MLFTLAHNERLKTLQRRPFCMESNWAKHGKPLAFTCQVIQPATSLCSFLLKLSSMSFSTLITHENPPVYSKSNLSRVADDNDGSILPGLPDDVAKYCFALVPRRYLPAMGAVCKKWRSFLKTKEFITVRKLAGLLQEWLFVLTMDSGGKESQWKVLDCLGVKRQLLPPMPGPTKTGFGVVVLNGKLLVMAGYSVIDGTGSASADVYEYDSCLNRFVHCTSMGLTFPQLL